MSMLKLLEPTFLSVPRRSKSLLCLAALCSLIGPIASLAADAPPPMNEKFTDLEPSIKMLRAEFGQDRRDIVASAMLLTPSEGEKFWPLYDEYRAAQHKVGDRKLKLISDFIAHRESMSEDQAEKLTEEALAVEKKRTSIKEDYVSKMAKELSARTVARFFQIDSKLDAVVDVAIAARVPLIK
jgi:hypothetical protein